MRYFSTLSENLIHPPDKPAGVFSEKALHLATNLVHPPDEPAGVPLQMSPRALPWAVLFWPFRPNDWMEIFYRNTRSSSFFGLALVFDLRRGLGQLKHVVALQWQL